MKHASIRVAVLTSAGALTALFGCSSDRVAPMGAGGTVPGGPTAAAGEASMMPPQPGKGCGDSCVSGDGCCGPACSSPSDSDCARTGEGTEVVGLDNSQMPPAGEMTGTEMQPPPPVACDESVIGGDAPNTLSIDVDAAAQTVHKEIFGVLMETLGRDVNGGLFVGRASTIPNTDGLRNDIIQGFIEAGVGIVQWPGGCAANNYNWEANVNPANTMGTDLFMEFCEMIGAEPYLTGRSRAGAADAASNRAWVEYINDNPAHPEWNLKYFKVGNEVWDCGGPQDQATYEANYLANYEALNPPVNGKELFIVAGTDLIGRNNNAWTGSIVANMGERVDGVEVHDYLYFPDSVPNIGFSDAQYYNIVNRANRGQIAPRIEQIVSLLDASDPSGRVKIMEDEWGNWLIGFNEAQDTWMQQGTVMDAVSAAEHLHVFMAHADRILMAALAQPVNVIQSLFLTRQGDGVLVKTPTFYVFKMFLPHHTANARWAPHALNSEMINGNNTNFPVLSSGATVDDTGAVNISLANVDLVNTRSIDVTLDSSTTSYSLASAQIITGEAKDTYNEFGQPERVNIQPLAAENVQACGRSLSVSLPSKSVVMLRLVPVAQQ
jgi:alpha-L-arabinofuranosidase